MAIFSKKIGPVFLKQDSDAAIFIDKMRALSEKATGSLKEDIENQIKLASYGEIGEHNIEFELKNSGMDMYILHDIYLEYEDLSAQIDYLVITRQYIYIVECKNLIGNIEIDNSGNFIRTYEMNGRKIKEGIYSPITQNERHRNVLKKVRETSKSNIISKALFSQAFNDTYRSMIVLANPKTVLNAKYAKKEVKDKVLRADQMIQYIKQTDAACKDFKMSDKEMLDLANFFLSKNKTERSDYSRKYADMLDKCTEQPQTHIDVQAKTCPRCGNDLVLRTAKQGANAGNQFYGCKGFPKCRYIENIN